MIQNLILASLITFGLGSPLSQTNERINAVSSIQLNTTYKWIDNIQAPTEYLFGSFKYIMNNTTYTDMEISTSGNINVFNSNEGWINIYTNGTFNQDYLTIKFITQPNYDNIKNYLMNNIVLTQEQTDLVTATMNNQIQEISNTGLMPIDTNNDYQLVSYRQQSVENIQLNNSLNRNTQMYEQIQIYQKNYFYHEEEAVESYILNDQYIFSQYNTLDQTKFQGTVKQTLNILDRVNFLNSNIYQVKMHVEIKSATFQQYDWNHVFNWQNTTPQHFNNIAEMYDNLGYSDSYTYTPFTLTQYSGSGTIGQEYRYNGNIEYSTTANHDFIYFAARIYTEVLISPTGNNFMGTANTLTINSRTLQAQLQYDLTVHITQEVINIPMLIFTIIGMPFTFVGQAFNLTLFPNTPYQINVSNLIIGIFTILIVLLVIKLIIKHK